MCTRNEHIIAIRAALDCLHDELDWDDNNGWTRKILTALCTVGSTTFGFMVGADSGLVPEVVRDRGEWLHDVTWLTGNYRMPLAAECELNPAWNPRDEPNGVKYDFCKLLVARADLRLMIISGQDGWKDNVAKMTELVNKCPATCNEDMYLIAVPVPIEPRVYDASGRTCWRFRWFKISPGFCADELTDDADGI